MSTVQVAGGASGTGTFLLVSPNSNTNQTQTLVDATGTIVVDSATQTLTNKTLTSPAISGAVMTTMASSVITRGTAVSASSTSVAFTGIPSWAKRITVMLRGVSGSGTSAFLLQLGTSGGYVTSGYVSQNSYLYSNIVTTSSTAGLLLTGANAAAESVTGQFIVSNQNSNTWVGNGGMARSGGVYLQLNAGGVDLGGTLDRIRVTTVNGTDTFDAGSINILYE